MAGCDAVMQVSSVPSPWPSHVALDNLPVERLELLHRRFGDAYQLNIERLDEIERLFQG